MKRALAMLVVLALAGAAAFASAGAGESKGTKYKIVFDNAFGLTQGVDLRVGGVKAGSVTKLDIERRTGRAVITVQITQPGFDSFRGDSTCSIRPQSLIGEYFVDCQPGKSGRKLADGATIPVEQTETTVPPDLVQSILRKPYRERFSIILSEFGGALASRGPELNETIRRAIPALTQTNRVLTVLDDNKQELQSLTRESELVLSRLADNRGDVSRFVSEARDSAAAAADRRTDLATTFRRLPGFLSQLRPTLADLGTAAEQQAPALTDLSNSAGDLTTFFNRLGPFADASRPAIRSLGQASKTGLPAVRDARPTIQQITQLTRNSPELANNLAIVLEHLTDRSHAVEKDANSPGGQGFTGLEAILQYPFVQSQAINVFDQRGYILKLLLLANECSAYTNAETAKKNPGRTKRCSGALGPNQPGVNQPDPSGAAAEAAKASASRTRSVARKRTSGKGGGSTPSTQNGNPSASPSPSGSSPTSPAAPPTAPSPAAPAPSAPAAPGGGSDSSLLDYLFGR